MIEIKKDIYWIGIRDWEIRSFHGNELSTHRGSSYNSYLIKDEKIVVVDTVWEPYKDIFVDNLEKEVGLQNIDMIVVNHCETDHSGSLPLLMSKIPNVPIYCTKNGAEMIKKHYHKDWNFNIVKTGDVIKTGKYELVFVEMAMLHWPDSMLTYIKGANVVLSNDAFGQHFTSTSMFNDGSDTCELYQEAIKYYANIITPYSVLAKKKIEQILAMKLEIDIIAPSHGIIWRDNPTQIVEKYYEWCQDYNEGHTVIVYDTMWNGTKKMATAIAAGLENKGTKVKVFNASLTDKSDLITELFKAKGIIVGSPTVNNLVLSPIAALIEDIGRMKFKNKIAAAFGTYGWSGEGSGLISQRLANAGLKIVQEPIKLKYMPTEEELVECVKFGEAFADKL